MRLFHFSEDPSIERFVPRPVRVLSERGPGRAHRVPHRRVGVSGVTQVRPLRQVGHEGREEVVAFLGYLVALEVSRQEVPAIELHHLQVGPCSVDVRFWREGDQSRWEVCKITAGPSVTKEEMIQVMDEPVVGSQQGR